MTATPSSTPPSTTADRLHGLDGLRGIALLLGIVVHASMSWLPGAQYFWVAHDGSSSAALGLAFYVPHMFRMLLFFLLAGFFGRMALQRLGTRGFVRDRGRRIALPLLAGWPLVMAAIVAVLAWGTLLAQGALPQEPPPGPKFTADDFPLTHLWFLYVLLWCYAAMLGLRALAKALDRAGALDAGLDRIARWLAAPAGPLLLATPLAIALALQPDWYAWFGIPTPDRALYPNLAASIGFGSAFAFGWLLHRQRALLRGWEGRWTLHLSLAVLATAACLGMAGLAPRLQPAPATGETLAYAACYAFAAWNWTFALTGLALRYLAGFSPARRYLADASYWMYLAHLPLVMALQVAASRFDAPAWIEFPLLLAATLVLLLASYHGLVRYGRIGAVLNGTRRPRIGSPAPAM
jgi:peptidoglycan/LPS O-acetylase OafA/YrhL